VDGWSNNEREGINVGYISLKLVAHVLGDALRRGRVVERGGRWSFVEGALASGVAGARQSDGCGREPSRG
jgi:hypothetical protein